MSSFGVSAGIANSFIRTRRGKKDEGKGGARDKALFHEYRIASKLPRMIVISIFLVRVFNIRARGDFPSSSSRRHHTHALCEYRWCMGTRRRHCATECMPKWGLLLCTSSFPAVFYIPPEMLPLFSCPTSYRCECENLLSSSRPRVCMEYTTKCAAYVRTWSFAVGK